MKWWWHVRIYNKAGNYWHGQLCTGRDLKEIDAIQDFYFDLTGCKMLIEGMRNIEFEDITPIQDSFAGLWGRTRPVEQQDIPLRGQLQEIVESISPKRADDLGAIRDRLRLLLAENV